jgi:hypothetical protein
MLLGCFDVEELDRCSVGVLLPLGKGFLGNGLPDILLVSWWWWLLLVMDVVVTKHILISTWNGRVVQRANRLVPEP